MQVGIDSFAAAFDEKSRAVNPADRLRQLVQQIEHADEVGVDAFGGANTIVVSFWIPRPRSSLVPRRHGRSTSG